jgi:hypothetical protein
MSLEEKERVRLDRVRKNAKLYYEKNKPQILERAHSRYEQNHQQIQIKV